MYLVQLTKSMRNDGTPRQKNPVYYLAINLQRPLHNNIITTKNFINLLNAESNPIRHLLALVGARHIVHVSRITVKSHPPFASIGRSSPYCPR